MFTVNMKEINGSVLGRLRLDGILKEEFREIYNGAALYRAVYAEEKFSLLDSYYDRIASGGLLELEVGLWPVGKGNLKKIDSFVFGGEALPKILSSAKTEVTAAKAEIKELNITCEIYDLKKKADEGSGMALLDLGRRYENGDGVSKDLDRALAIFLTAANSEHAWTKQEGSSWLRWQAKKGHAEALVWLQNSAADGDAESQSFLAKMYETGEVVERDLRKAVSFYEASARAGYSLPMLRLAQLFETESSPHDATKAAHWYRQFLDLERISPGDRFMAITGLFKLAKLGEETAIDWFLGEAEAGDLNAMVNLGLIYMDESGPEHSFDRARAWLKKAADRNSSSGYYFLGLMSYRGWGEPQNIDKAETLWQTAAAIGDKRAEKALEQLSEER
jgi:TPR repeat protein